MNDPRLPRTLYFVILLMGLLQWVRVYPLLPERMASHFSFDGTPNGWQSKEAFFTGMFVVIATSAFVAFLIPLLMAFSPDNLINLPNKKYWLAPERREETYRFFGAQMGWFGCGLLFFLLNATWQAIKVNLPHAERFNSQGMFQVLVGFLILTMFWTIHLLRHFYAVPDFPPSSNREQGWK